MARDPGEEPWKLLDGGAGGPRPPSGEEMRRAAYPEPMACSDEPPVAHACCTAALTGREHCPDYLHYCESKACCEKQSLWKTFKVLLGEDSSDKKLGKEVEEVLCCCHVVWDKENIHCNVLQREIRSYEQGSKKNIVAFVQAHLPFKPGSPVFDQKIVEEDNKSYLGLIRAVNSLGFPTKKKNKKKGKLPIKKRDTKMVRKGNKKYETRRNSASKTVKRKKKKSNLVTDPGTKCRRKKNKGNVQDPGPSNSRAVRPTSIAGRSSQRSQGASKKNEASTSNRNKRVISHVAVKEEKRSSNEDEDGASSDSSVDLLGEFFPSKKYRRRRQMIEDNPSQEISKGDNVRVLRKRKTQSQTSTRDEHQEDIAISSRRTAVVPLVRCNEPLARSSIKTEDIALNTPSNLPVPSSTSSRYRTHETDTASDTPRIHSVPSTSASANSKNETDNRVVDTPSIPLASFPTSVSENSSHETENGASDESNSDSESSVEIIRVNGIEPVSATSRDDLYVYSHAFINSCHVLTYSAAEERSFAFVVYVLRTQVLPAIQKIIRGRALQAISNKGTWNMTDNGEMELSLNISLHFIEKEGIPEVSSSSIKGDEDTKLSVHQRENGNESAPSGPEEYSYSYHHSYSEDGTVHFPFRAIDVQNPFSLPFATLNRLVNFSLSSGNPRAMWMKRRVISTIIKAVDGTSIERWDIICTWPKDLKRGAQIILESEEQRRDMTQVNVIFQFSNFVDDDDDDDDNDDTTREDHVSTRLTNVPSEVRDNPPRTDTPELLASIAEVLEFLEPSDERNITDTANSRGRLCEAPTIDVNDGLLQRPSTTNCDKCASLARAGPSVCACRTRRREIRLDFHKNEVTPLTPPISPILKEIEGNVSNSRGVEITGFLMKRNKNSHQSLADSNVHQHVDVLHAMSMDTNRNVRESNNNIDTFINPGNLSENYSVNSPLFTPSHVTEACLTPRSETASPTSVNNDERLPDLTGFRIESVSNSCIQRSVRTTNCQFIRRPFSLFDSGNESPDNFDDKTLKDYRVSTTEFSPSVESSNCPTFSDIIAIPTTIDLSDDSGYEKDESYHSLPYVSNSRKDSTTSSRKQLPFSGACFDHEAREDDVLLIAAKEASGSPQGKNSGEDSNHTFTSDSLEVTTKFDVLPVFNTPTSFSDELLTHDGSNDAPIIGEQRNEDEMDGRGFHQSVQELNDIISTPAAASSVGEQPTSEEYPASSTFSTEGEKNGSTSVTNLLCQMHPTSGTVTQSDNSNTASNLNDSQSPKENFPFHLTLNYAFVNELSDESETDCTYFSVPLRREGLVSVVEQNVRVEQTCIVSIPLVKVQNTLRMMDEETIQDKISDIERNILMENETRRTVHQDRPIFGKLVSRKSAIDPVASSSADFVPHSYPEVASELERGKLTQNGRGRKRKQLTSVQNGPVKARYSDPNTSLSVSTDENSSDYQGETSSLDFNSSLESGATVMSTLEAEEIAELDREIVDDDNNTNKEIPLPVINTNIRVEENITAEENGMPTKINSESQCSTPCDVDRIEVESIPHCCSTMNLELTSEPLNSLATNEIDHQSGIERIYHLKSPEAEDNLSLPVMPPPVTIPPLDVDERNQKGTEEGTSEDKEVTHTVDTADMEVDTDDVCYSSMVSMVNEEVNSTDCPLLQVPLMRKIRKSGEKEMQDDLGESNNGEDSQASLSSRCERDVTSPRKSLDDARRREQKKKKKEKYCVLTITGGDEGIQQKNSDHGSVYFRKWNFIENECRGCAKRDRVKERTELWVKFGDRFPHTWNPERNSAYDEWLRRHVFQRGLYGVYNIMGRRPYRVLVEKKSGRIVLPSDPRLRSEWYWDMFKFYAPHRRPKVPISLIKKRPHKEVNRGKARRAKYGIHRSDSELEESVRGSNRRRMGRAGLTSRNDRDKIVDGLKYTKRKSFDLRDSPRPHAGSRREDHRSRGKCLTRENDPAASSFDGPIYERLARGLGFPNREASVPRYPSPHRGDDGSPFFPPPQPSPSVARPSKRDPRLHGTDPNLHSSVTSPSTAITQGEGSEEVVWRKNAHGDTAVDPGTGGASHRWSTWMRETGAEAREFRERVFARDRSERFQYWNTDWDDSLSYQDGRSDSQDALVDDNSVGRMESDTEDEYHSERDSYRSGGPRTPIDDYYETVSSDESESAMVRKDSEEWHQQLPALTEDLSAIPKTSEDLVQKQLVKWPTQESLKTKHDIQALELFSRRAMVSSDSDLWKRRETIDLEEGIMDRSLEPSQKQGTFFPPPGKPCSLFTDYYPPELVVRPRSDAPPIPVSRDRVPKSYRPTDSIPNSPPPSFPSPSPPPNRKIIKPGNKAPQLKMVSKSTSTRDYADARIAHSSASVEGVDDETCSLMSLSSLSPLREILSPPLPSNPPPELPPPPPTSPPPYPPRAGSRINKKH